MKNLVICQSENYPGDTERALQYVSSGDAKRFCKKFRQQRGDFRQSSHTYKELLVGVFAALQEYQPIFEPTLSGKTPDWLIRQHEGNDFYIADVVNFHIDSDIEKEMTQKLSANHHWHG